MNTAHELRLGPDGAQFFPAAIDATGLDELQHILSPFVDTRAGVRLFGSAGLHRFVSEEGALGRIVATTMDCALRPVRAILFDKSTLNNWSLGWHQDRVVAVRERLDVPGFGAWTRKRGVVHVAPPFDVIARMTTVRLHLDDVPDSNAPLMVALGSHLCGQIAERDIPTVVERHGSYSCLALAGDAWLYATSILHSSVRASQPKRRRVLQVDYFADDLPGGLKWFAV